MGAFHWLWELRFNPRKIWQYQVFIQECCPYNLTASHWSGGPIVGHTHQGQWWGWGCGIAIAPCRNATAGSKITHQEQMSNCLWVCHLSLLISQGNPYWQFLWRIHLHTPAGHCQSCVQARGRTSLQGRWNGKTIHERLRMQRTHPLSGGCSSSILSPIPARFQQDGKGAGIGTSGKDTQLSEPDLSRDPAGEEVTGGDSCPTSKKEPDWWCLSRAPVPLQNWDLSLQVQRDHFVSFAKHHHPTWI